MKFGNLMNTRPGDVVLLANHNSFQVFRVVRVRDRRDEPLLADTYRRRPLNIRSQGSVTLRDTRSGRLQTRYFAENILAAVGEMA
jgi:hypothetical protein